MCDRARRVASPLDHGGPASMDAVGELHRIAKHAYGLRCVINEVINVAHGSSYRATAPAAGDGA